MLKIGCVMGIFQAGMTIAGYLAGMSFKKYITAFAMADSMQANDMPTASASMLVAMPNPHSVL